MIEDGTYHHQTINCINLYNIYGHLIEGNMYWEAEEIIDVCVEYSHQNRKVDTATPHLLPTIKC